MVSISLDQQLPDGPWNANISLTSGLLEESYQARIQFPPNPGATAPVPAQKSVDNYLGIILIGVLLAALVTVAVLVVVRHRSRQKANRQLV
jgi:hypothetical protein